MAASMKIAVFCFQHCSSMNALMMEAARTCETLVNFYQLRPQLTKRQPSSPEYSP
jgi:hypothetical protein